MVAYYNEIDPFAAQWLRTLITQGHLPCGDVDERSIEDVRPDDLRPYTHCHFFAGIGVWPYALLLAGWDNDRPVWTGSEPCQPHSSAGKMLGAADERYLRPAWHHLIEHGKPRGVPVFGEQVSNGGGNLWIDTLQNDMAGIHHEVWALDIPVASVGAPHIRQRWLWVAHSKSRRFPKFGKQMESGHLRHIDGGDFSNRMADSFCERGCSRESQCENAGDVRQPIETGGVAYSDGRNASAEGIQRFGQYGQQPNDSSIMRCAISGVGHNSDGKVDRAGPVNGYWRDADWLFCRDGKWRPVESGTFPLAHGAPARVGRLRGYGNAVNAKAVQAFIEAYDGVGA